MKVPNNPEFQRFTEAMRTIMSVSKAEVVRLAEEERAKRPPQSKPGPKAKTSASHGPGVASTARKP